MNTPTAYRPRNIRSPFQPTKPFHPAKQAQPTKAFNFKDKRNSVHAEMESCMGAHQITAFISEDTQTISTMNNLPGLIAFICRLESSDGRVLAEGRGSSVLSQNNKYVSRAIYSAFNSSIVDAVMRSTKVLDTFRGTSEIEQSRMALDEAYHARGCEESEPATEKQKGYILQLINQNITDDLERQQHESQIDDLTKQEASAMIEAFRQ